MADTATVSALAESSADKGRPDRSRTLALDAVDEAYKDEVKHLVDVMHSGLISAPGDIDKLAERATNGLATAQLAWRRMRNIVNGIYGVPE